MNEKYHQNISPHSSTTTHILNKWRVGKAYIPSYATAC